MHSLFTRILLITTSNKCISQFNWNLLLMLWHVLINKLQSWPAVLLLQCVQNITRKLCFRTSCVRSFGHVFGQNIAAPPPCFRGCVRWVFGSYGESFHCFEGRWKLFQEMSSVVYLVVPPGLELLYRTLQSSLLVVDTVYHCLPWTTVNHGQLAMHCSFGLKLCLPWTTISTVDHGYCFLVSRITFSRYCWQYLQTVFFFFHFILYLFLQKFWGYLVRKRPQSLPIGHCYAKWHPDTEVTPASGRDTALSRQDVLPHPVLSHPPMDRTEWTFGLRSCVGGSIQ